MIVELIGLPLHSKELSYCPLWMFGLIDGIAKVSERDIVAILQRYCVCASICPDFVTLTILSVPDRSRVMNRLSSSFDSSRLVTYDSMPSSFTTLLCSSGPDLLRYRINRTAYNVCVALLRKQFQEFQFHIVS
jgi:hypothetical protein